MDDAASYAEAVLDGFPAFNVPVYLVADTITQIELRKAKMIASGDYLTAQRHQERIDELKFLNTESTYDGIHQDRCHEIHTRLMTAQRQLADRAAAADRVLQKFTQQRQADLDGFDERARQELATFDETHPPAALPAKFRKYSYEYLNLRMRERYMVSSKRYMEAEALKAEADALEIVEIERQRRNWDDYVTKKRQLLIAQKAEQRRILEEKWDRDWRALRPSATADVARRENVVRALESKLVEVEGEHNVAFDGAATRGPSRAVTSRSLPVARPQLPRLPMAPRQPNHLRARMRYVRTKNYDQAHKRNGHM
jgi:hypothetical protein